MSKKLNKSQQFALATTNLQAIIEGSELVAKTKKDDLLAELMTAINFLAPTTATSTKVNDEGLVWCNYFEDYLPATDFKTKVNTKKYKKLLDEGWNDTEATIEATGYRANSIQAEEILRKAKLLRKRLEQQAMTEFRFKRLTDAELNDMLDIAESFTTNTYSSIDDIPTIWDAIMPTMGEDTANMMKEEIGV